VAATNELTNQMLALARLSPGDKVLDIGCGTGKAACRMAADFGAEVTGLSPSAQCVADATAKAKELSQQHLMQFQIGDGMAPDFPDNSFDCTWVMEPSHLMTDKSAMLKECARVLKPGGRLVLRDIMLDHPMSLQDAITYRDEFLLLKDVYGRGDLEPLTFYEEHCKANGLRVEHCRNITSETLRTFDCWRKNALAHKATVCDLIGEEAWQQFLDSCDVLQKFWLDKVLGYGIISACKPA